MKFLKTLMLVAVAATAFTACQKEEQSMESNEVAVHIKATSVASRSAFLEPDGTTYPTRWSGTESVKFSLNFSNSPKSATAVTEDGGKTADFEVALTDDNSGSYTIYGLSPATSAISFNADYKLINVEIPNIQTPLDNSCDEAAQVLAGKSVTTDAFSSDIVMTFKHVTAYGLMSLKNFSATGEIATIALTSEQNIAGRFYYYPNEGSMNSNSTFKMLSLNTNKTENIWFACAPADWSNTTLTVDVTMTDGGVYTATKVFPAERVMESGKIAIFSVDMSAATYTAPVQYTLVTNPYNLAIGDKFIIAAKDFDVALSTTQNGSGYRNSTAIVKDGNVILSPSSSVEIFEIENAATDNFVFKATQTAGYLHNNSTSNKVYTTDEVIYWTLGIEDGSAVLKMKDTSIERNWLRYNSSSPRFACYGSGQADIALYAISGGNTPTPAFSVTAESTDVAPTATTATFQVAGNVAWTATISGDATFENGTKSLSGTGATEVQINFAANTSTENEINYSVTVSTEAEVATKNYELVFTQAKAAAAGSAGVGETLWSEDWSGFENSVVPTTNGSGTVVFGEKAITYSCVGSSTKIYSTGTAYAGGTLPEILIAKSNGSLKVADIPTGNATKVTLSFKSNKANTVFNISTSVAGATVETPSNLSWTITLPSGTKVFDVTITNTSSSNARVDNLQIVVAQ